MSGHNKSRASTMLYRTVPGRLPVPMFTLTTSDAYSPALDIKMTELKVVKYLYQWPYDQCKSVLERKLGKANGTV